MGETNSKRKTPRQKAKARKWFMRPARLLFFKYETIATYVIKSIMVGFTERVITVDEAEKAEDGKSRCARSRFTWQAKCPFVPEPLAKAGLTQSGCADFSFVRGALASRLPAQDMRGLGTALA